MRILVVEDDVLVARGLKQGLRQLGYTVDVAGSAEDADRFVQMESFDLLLGDIGLPKADGLQFIRQLRDRGEKLPALILTARDDVEDTVRARCRCRRLPGQAISPARTGGAHARLDPAHQRQDGILPAP